MTSLIDINWGHPNALSIVVFVLLWIPILYCFGGAAIDIIRNFNWYEDDDPGIDPEIEESNRRIISQIDERH